MIHYFNLNNKPFSLIKDNKKHIEMRLNTQKTCILKINDFIIFTNNESKEELKVKIKDIKSFNNFTELYNYYDKSLLGYSKNEIASPNDMLEYYLIEQIEKNGVFAIEIEKV